MLPAAANLIHLVDGRIDIQGRVEDLRSAGLLETIVQEERSEGSEKYSAEDIRENEKAAEKDQGNPDPKTLTEKEHRETERVSWAIYKTYLQAA